MEWVSESAAVRRHRVGGERRDGPAAAPPPEREARALETLVDARGGSGSARTRKRSGAGSGGASGAARTGLSEARAALGLALYLLALRTLVQLSLQQLVLHGAPGHPREFNARQARYWPPSRPRVPSRPLAGARAPHLVHPPLRDRPGSPAPPDSAWGGVPLRVPLLETPFPGRAAGWHRPCEAGGAGGVAEGPRRHAAPCVPHLQPVCWLAVPHLLEQLSLLMNPSAFQTRCRSVKCVCLAGFVNSAPGQVSEGDHAVSGPTF